MSEAGWNESNHIIIKNVKATLTNTQQKQTETFITNTNSTLKVQAHLAKATSHCLLDTKELYSGDTGNGRERRVRKWTDQIGAPVSPNSHCVGSGAWCPR